MTATLTEARNDIMGIVNTAWAAGTHTAGELLLFEGLSGSRPVANVANVVQLWGRVSARMIDSGQSTLSGETGNRRFRRLGLLTIQVFSPNDDGLTVADVTAQELLDALEGVTSTNGVVFRNVRIQPVGEDGPWFQTNVLANYDFDEVK